jgi:hypothetical protein
VTARRWSCRSGVQQPSDGHVHESPQYLLRVTSQTADGYIPPDEPPVASPRLIGMVRWHGGVRTIGRFDRHDDGGRLASVEWHYYPRGRELLRACGYVAEHHCRFSAMCVIDGVWDPLLALKSLLIRPVVRDPKLT